MSRLDVEVGTRLGPLQTGLNKARGMVSGWASGIKGTFAGAFAFGAIISTVKTLLDQAEDLSDAAERYAVSTEFLQKAANVASVTGSKFQDVESALKALTRRSQMAIDSNNEYRKSFVNLGLSLDDLKTMSPDQLFMAIADSVENATDRSQAFKDVMNVAGLSSKNLFTMFSMGRDEIERLGEEMGVMGDETAASLANANVSMRKVGNQIKTGLAVGLHWVIMTVQTLTGAFSAMFQIAGAGFTWVGRRIQSNIESYRALAGLLPRLGEAVKDALTGNISGAIDKAKELKGEFDEIAKKNKAQNAGITNVLKSDVSATNAGFNEYMEEEVFGRKPDDGSDNKVDREGLDIAKQKASLAEKIAEQKRKAQFEELTADEKLATLKEEQASWEKLANDNTLEGMEASLKVLELQEQIKAVTEEIADDSAKVADEREREAEKLDRLRARAQELKDALAFDKLSTEEKIIKLREEEVRLAKAAKKEDEEGLKARIALMENRKQQTQLGEEKEREDESALSESFGKLRSKLSVDADFLARVGGGGRVAKVAPVTQQLLVEFKAVRRYVEKMAKNSENGNSTEIKIDPKMQ